MSAKSVRYIDAVGFPAEKTFGGVIVVWFPQPFGLLAQRWY